MPFTPRNTALPGIAKKTTTTNQGMQIDHVSLEPGVIGEAVGSTYPRKNGKIKYNGKWHHEGSHEFPWEQRAMKAEKKV